MKYKSIYYTITHEPHSTLEFLVWSSSLQCDNDDVDATAFGSLLSENALTPSIEFNRTIFFSTLDNIHFLKHTSARQHHQS